MNSLEKDIINKLVVLEEAEWKIYIGYDDIRPHIAKYEELGNLLAAKSVINEMAEVFSNMDNTTGLLNKKGFIEAAEKEIWRSGRHGNAFSIIMLEVDPGKGTSHGNVQAFRQYCVASIGDILKNSLRKLDLIGRWDEMKFIILMPETGLIDGIKAALKMKKVFYAKKFLFNNRVHKLNLHIGVDEYRGSLESTVEFLNHYIAVARKYGENKVVHSSGLYE